MCYKNLSKKSLFFIFLFLIIFSNILLYAQDNNKNNSNQNNQIDENINTINQNLTDTEKTQNKNNSNSIASFLLRTIIVLIILAISYFIIKYRFSKANLDKKSKKNFNIILQQPISRNLSLAVLEFFNTYYIISIGSDITILEKLENQEIIDAIKLESSKEIPKKTFLEYLGLSQTGEEKVNILNKFDQIKEKMSKIKKGNQ